MNQKTKEYREKLAESFLDVLEEKQLDWKKEWNAQDMPQNGITKRPYQGINCFYLKMVAMQQGYEDPRWVTFQQCKERGWLLRGAKGKGVKVEYWFPYDKEEKKGLTWQEFREQKLQFDERYMLRVSYKTVFNADLVDGISEWKPIEREEINVDEIIQKLEKNMDVKIYNDGGDRAYYSVTTDDIHLPKTESFDSVYAYHATALHELTHASGAKHRLNRDLSHSFGTQEYAKEELVAEITSCFMSAYLPMEQSEYHVNNHKAYVQSWMRALKDDPDILIGAIRQAEQTAAYMEEKAELIMEKDYQKVKEASMELPESVIYPEKAEENDRELKDPMKACMARTAARAPMKIHILDLDR